MTRFVREAVRVDDPQPRAEGNRVLTSELREALGTDELEVPAERASETHRLPVGERRTVASLIGANRMLVAVAFVPLLVIAVIISLSTDSWWAVVAAYAVHAVGTLIVASIVLRATTAVERVAPESAARLREEGVGDPDQALSDMVERLGSAEGDRAAMEVVECRNNRITASPGEDRAQVSAEQRTAMTPAASAGTRGTPMVLPIVAVASSALVAIAVAVWEGGIAWIGALLLLAVSLAWLLLMRRLASGERRDDARVRRRTP
jgi:membrane protein implicated in regulation of membrane protease activity